MPPSCAGGIMPEIQDFAAERRIESMQETRFRVLSQQIFKVDGGGSRGSPSVLFSPFFGRPPR